MAALGGCSDIMNVENERDILDADLNTPGAVGPLVAGVAGDYAVAYANAILITGLFSSELIHTGSFPTWREVEEGIGTRPSVTGNQMYNQASRAIWVADDAVRRMREVLDDAANRPEVAEALIWGAFAHLILADNFCEATIAAGPAMTPEAVYKRAEGHFTEALNIATNANKPDLRLRAIAGRARTRLMLGDYTGAIEDASRIPDNFRFLALYSDNSTREYNAVANQTRTLTRREAGVHPRFYNDPRYISDPRTPFITRGANETGPDPTRQYVEQEKYALRNTPIPVFTGQEARLIEAEAELRLGNVTQAVELINKVRTASNLAPYSGPMTAEAVMAQLMYERSAELWLQGQHLNDLRRTNHPYLETRRNRCFEIGIDEWQTNPNLGGN
jgi:hypothetical protein